MEKEIIKFNNISEKLKKDIGEIPKGGKYTFELLSIGIDSSDQDPKFHRQIGTGPTGIPNRCNIRDPYTKEFVEIAYIERYEADGTPVFGEITFLPENGGQIDTYDRRPSDHRLYQYLKLCHWNMDSPCRNGDINPEFKEINLVKDAEKEFDILQVKDTAIAKFMLLDYNDMVAYLKRMNLPTSGTEKEVKLRLRKHVEKDPRGFINSIGNESDRQLSVLALAEERGIIFNNNSKCVWQWGQTEDEICKYSRHYKTGETRFTKLLDWIREDSNGKKVFTEIENRLKTKDEIQHVVVG